MTKFAFLSQLPHVDNYRSFKVSQGHVCVLLLTSLLHYRHLQQQNCLLATAKDINRTTMATILDSDRVKHIDVKRLTVKVKDLLMSHLTRLFKNADKIIIIIIIIIQETNVKQCIFSSRSPLWSSVTIQWLSRVLFWAPPNQTSAMPANLVFNS